MSPTKSNNLFNLDEDEIKNKFEDIKDTLKANSFLNINTPEDLFNLRSFLLHQLEPGYFKSDRHKIAFLLSKYESNAFNEELGITRRHFVDKKVAKAWMTKMQHKFHPDKNKDITYDIDFTKISDGINKAYTEMVGQK
jgi:hypothetical protein